MHPQSSDILEFTGQYRWLSNFFPCSIQYDGMGFPSVENAYQAAKEINREARWKYGICSPVTAKKWGKRAWLRPSWGNEKLGIMEVLTRQKFNHPEFKELLLATGTGLIVEGNTWGDTFWGVCNGEGENHLGKIIMKIRGELCQTIL